MEVLSINLLTIDLQKATPVLIFVGCLFGLIVIGLTFFLKWDKLDRHKAVYLREYEMKALRDKIEEDIAKGGSGAILDIDIRKKNESKLFKKTVNQITSLFLNKAKIDIYRKDFEVPASSFYPKIGSIDKPAIIENEYIDKKEIDLEYSMIQKSPAVLTAEFSNIILNLQASKQAENYEKGKPLISMSETIDVITRAHYFTAMWMNPSVRVTRFIRFLQCVKMILLSIFIDTLVFGIFFPSDGRCDLYTNQFGCIKEPSKIIVDARMCTWNKEIKRCYPTPAPTDIIFTLLIAMLIIILMRFTALLMNVVLKNYCAKRPRLSDIGLNVNDWLGSVYYKQNMGKSPLTLAVMKKMKIFLVVIRHYLFTKELVIIMKSSLQNHHMNIKQQLILKL